MNVLLLGATGLVGQHLLHLLMNDNSVSRITLLLRHLPSDLVPHSKVKIHQISDFMQLSDDDVAGYSHVISCLGTTQKKAGSKQQFYAIDYGINAHVASLCVNSSIHFLIVSALGANAQSAIFYNRVKGELEQYLKALNLAKLSIVQPSLLMGERQEQRLLEDLGQSLFKVFNKIYSPSFLSKPVAAEKVAQCLLNAVKNQSQSLYVYDNLAIQNQ